MPSLRVCGGCLPTPWAGDDLRALALATALVRLLQLGLATTLLVVLVSAEGGGAEAEAELPLPSTTCTNNNNNKRFRVSYLLYCASTMVLAMVSLGLTIPMYILSGRGTPTEAGPRHPAVLERLFTWQLTVGVGCRVLVFLWGIGTVRIYRDYCQCLYMDDDNNDNDDDNYACSHHGAWISTFAASLLTQAIDVAAAALSVTHLSCQVLRRSARGRRRRLDLTTAERRWKVSLACCFACSSILTCCIFGGNEATLGDFGDFASILANYFNNNDTLDLTASDLVAGVVMLLCEQRLEREETRRRLQQESGRHRENLRPRSSKILLRGSTSSSLVGDDHSRGGSAAVPSSGRSSIVISSDQHHNDKTWESMEPATTTSEVLLQHDPRDAYVIAEAARFIPLAQATYGCISYLLEQPLTGICTLAARIVQRSACCRRREQPYTNVHGDYICQPHTTAMVSIAGLDDDDEQDIVYASFVQGIRATPYVIVLDREWKSVVVAIRGTLSLESLLADLSISPCELSEWGSKCGFDGNESYCHDGMLSCAEWIYNDLQRHGKLDELFTEEASTNEYRLRIVGHSLGAGVAAILSLFLRSQYPTLRCLAFSAPGCVFSERMADASREWITTFVLDADVVPRLCIESFESLRDGVLQMICRIKVPKRIVMDHWRSGKLEDIKDLLYDPADVKDTEFKRRVDDFLVFQAELKEKTRDKYIPLYPPGKIIQLFRTGTKQRSLARMRMAELEEELSDNYTARWLDRSQLQSIALSSHLMGDHDPIKVKRKIQELASNFGLEEPTYLP